MRSAAALVVVLVMVTGSSATAQESEGADPQNVAATLADLDAAGTPASAAEIAEFLADAATPGMEGLLTGRAGFVSGQPLSQTYRLHLTRRWWDVRGRWRQYPDGTVEGAGAVILGTQRWQLAVGQLGLAHGYGLFVGKPGRGPTLTADGSLGSGGQSFRPWVGAAVPQTLWGVGAAGGWGPVTVRLLTGRREDQGTAGPLTSVGQVVAAGDGWQVAGLVLSAPTEVGTSLAGRWRSGPLAGSWEGVWRRPLGAARGLGTMLAHGGWRPHRLVRLELLAGWADLGPRPIMGQKHPVFGDWAGQGLALRGTWRVVAGLGLKILVHRGRGQEEIQAGRRRVRALTDVLLARTWPGGWLAEARWRQGDEEVSVWSERFPWQAAALDRRDSRRVVSLKGGWRGDRARAVLLWRRLNLDRTRQGVGWEAGGTRELLALSFRRRLNRLCQLRGAWTVAWGDAVDLVSAVVPFRGYVLPRHWGHWRSEQLLGLEIGDGRWRCRGAVSWRQVNPQSPPAEVDHQLGAWLEGGWQW